MQSPARTPIDYPAHIQKARVLRAEAFAAAMTAFRRWLRAGETLRAAHTR